MARMQRKVNTVELKVPCKAEYVHLVRTVVGEMADSIPLPPDAVDEVKVAVSEAVANIVRHAYGADLPNAPIVIRCSSQGGALTVEVIDKGIGFVVPAAYSIPSPEVTREKEGGLGIALIRHLMDRVEYCSRPNWGTRIKMTKGSRIPDEMAGLASLHH